MNTILPIDKKTMEIIMATPKEYVGSMTFELKIPISSSDSKRPKTISPEEASKIFGTSLAVKMNFIPQMIIALALDYVKKFVDYCRDRRIYEFRKHNRLLLTCVDEYNANLRKSYANAYRAYKNYLERYFISIDIDRFKMELSIGNVVNRQVSVDQGREILKYIVIIHNLLNYAEKYEKEIDSIISNKIKAPITRNQDKLLTVIIAMCLEFEHLYNFKFGYNDIVETNMAVLSNRAAFLADTIIGEESKCQ